MKVLCVGDSMGMPRKGCLYEDTWFYRIQKLFPDYSFIDKFRRNNTSKEICYEDDYSVNYSPDVVILQIGICDCSPRIINEKKVIWRALVYLTEKIGVESSFWTIIKRLYKRNDVNRVWVPLPDFKIYIEDYVKRLLDECKTKRIIIIGICTPSIELQQRSPLLAHNVEKYNSFYKDLSNKYKDKIFFINPLCNADKDLYVDGYHANKKGNDVVLESLVRVLNNTL